MLTPALITSSLASSVVARAMDMPLGRTVTVSPFLMGRSNAVVLWPFTWICPLESMFRMPVLDWP